MKDLLEDYLESINTMTSLTLDSVTVLYGLDQKRTSLHRNIYEELKKYFVEPILENRLKIIFSNLDKAIDIQFPIDRSDSLAVYARDLERLLTCAETKYFLTGKTVRMHGKYGDILEDEK